MNILLIGSGGREHALAWKIAQSPLTQKLFVAQGNAGTRSVAENVALDASNHEAVIRFCDLMAIDLVVIGPEIPLVDGLADALRARGIKAFGPSAAAAQLEGSKAFTKAICDARNIPTAAYASFDDLVDAKTYVETQGAPIVIKADGLAAGKGVTVAETKEQALDALDDCFASPGASVVVEEMLVGEEASMFFLCDGLTALPFGTAQDHKRVGDGDTGPNTGGMGAYSPAPVMTDAFQEDVLTRIVQPTLDEMAGRGTPFSGILYAGLILTDDGPKLIEYNVRFGDPECQVLMMRLDEDIVPLLKACAEGELDPTPPRWNSHHAMTVVMAASGYPGKAATGTKIGLPDAVMLPDTITIFHAGTATENGELVSAGGRVLNITATGETLQRARNDAYAVIDNIDWPEGFCRRDIGWRALGGEAT